MTLKLSISGGDYDAVFYPGGHGPLWDLAGGWAYKCCAFSGGIHVEAERRQILQSG
jgi:hypothetical protein